jgi:hypothetical protein
VTFEADCDWLMYGILQFGRNGSWGRSGEVQLQEMQCESGRGKKSTRKYWLGIPLIIV